MEPRPARSTISILRTVLHLLEGDPAIDWDSETVLEFKRATMTLIAEVQAKHGISKESLNPSLDQAKLLTLLKQ
jgi:hypothetical protein